MKRFIKKGFIYIFVAIVLVSLCSCQVSKEQKESFLQKEEQERLSHLPPLPSGCDDSGNFPKIEGALAREYIISEKGIGDTSKPDERINSFYEESSAAEFLKLNFPHIDDWSVEYEYHDYYLRNDMYDPFGYCFRDMYLPSSMVILKTNEGEDFDRLFLSYFKSYQLLAEGDFFIPREEMSFSYHLSYKREWQSDDFSEAEMLCDGMYYSGIWFKEQQNAMLFPEAGERALIVKNVKERPLPLLSVEKSIFVLPSYENGERDFFAITASEKDSTDSMLMLYNSEDKTLSAFEQAENLHIIPLEKGIFAINNKSELCIFDLSGENPHKPIKILKDFSKKGSIATVATDRENPQSHALAYKDTEEKWHIVAFSSRGEIKNEYPLSIDMSYLYDYDFSLADGIIYLNNRILDDTYRFASNIAPGVDNSCKLLRIDRKRDDMSIYKKPLYYLALTGQEFKSPKDIKNFPEIAERIFDMLENDPNSHFWKKFPNGRISVDGMMEYISLMFDIDKQTVVSNSRDYLKGESTIEYMPHEDVIPMSISYSHATAKAPVWEGETGYVIFGCIDEQTREMKEGFKYKVTVRKDSSSYFGFKFLSMEKIE